MADLEVYGVDFLKGRGHLSFGKLTLKTPAHRFFGESIPIDQIAYIETVSSHTTKDAGAGIEAGIAGAVLAGTPGFLAGVMLGKSKGQISFVARFKDRRILLATTDHATYNTLLSAALANRRIEHDLPAGEPHSTSTPLIELTKQCPSCAETIKIQALKCRFCGEVFDPGEVASIMANQQKDSFDNRVLCSDGNCIGVIGADGRCKECGKPR
jgi:hypothetical protein